ncbi:PAS domain-containing protein [Heyndrickxia acidicola]|uniref:PAS domain-containing protein n=1 Tax=Heyndrickxia acidicola TaxID=209389 RepID=A0ABU6MID1_9BACI|nr:PAS domain-containing protein [Heyndrickxia acidicola]MED1204430.1 PAS domain-containing protein [Heyndrickxia acidicola]
MAEQHSILNHDWELLVQALNASQSGIVITDPDLDDNPIIYVNEGFTRITGYEAEDILGKNCRFLQGQLTKNDDVKKIKQTLENFTSVSLTLLNYRKDGEIFYNQLTIDPVYNDKEQKYYFFGVQKDITNEVLYQQRLGDALAEIEQLSTPIVPLEEGISIVPLIGILSDKLVDILFSTLASYKALSSHHTLLIDLSGLVSYLR